MTMTPMRRSRSLSHLDLNTNRCDPEDRGRIQPRANSLDVSVGGSGASQDRGRIQPRANSLDVSVGGSGASQDRGRIQPRAKSLDVSVGGSGASQDRGRIQPRAKSLDVSVGGSGASQDRGRIQPRANSLDVSVGGSGASGVGTGSGGGRVCTGAGGRGGVPGGGGRGGTPGGGGRGGTTGGGGRGGTAGGGGRGAATFANRNPEPVNLGMQIVGILIIPVVVGVIGGLSQLVMGVEKVDPNEKLMLYICAGISLTTVVLATVLVILCFVRWDNNRRRDCIMWSMIAAAVSLTFIDMCVFIVSLLIAVQSKKH